MKTWFSFARTDANAFWAARSMVFLAVAIMLWTPNMAGQQTALPKLNLAQIEGLVSHGVPDATMAAQIQRRGLTFKPTSAIIESLRAKGAGPLVLSDLRDRTSGMDRPDQPISPRPEVNPSDSAARLPDAKGKITFGTTAPQGGPPQQDIAEFGSRFSWYVDKINRAIAQNWYKPEVDPRTPNGFRAYIRFVIHRDGSITGLQIDRSSGSPTLDRSCLNAVRRIDSFSALPAAFGRDDLSVSYYCEYTKNEVSGLVKGAPPKVAKTITGCLVLNVTDAQLSAISRFQDTHPQFVRYDFGPNEYADGSCLEKSQQWQMSDGDEVAQYPFAVWGDFNHDGFLDLALFFVGKLPALTHKWPMNGNFVYTYEYDWLIVVFHGSQDGSYAPVIAGRDRWANAMDGVIFHRGRGRIEYWFKSAGGSVQWTGSGYRIEPMTSED